MRGKSKMFTVRMTEQDFKIISAKAELEGVSIAEFLRSAALGKRVDGFSKKKATADIDAPLKGQMSIKDLEEE
mgnify:FL=1